MEVLLDTLFEREHTQQTQPLEAFGGNIGQGCPIRFHLQGEKSIKILNPFNLDTSRVPDKDQHNTVSTLDLLPGQNRDLHNADGRQVH